MKTTTTLLVLMFSLSVYADGVDIPNIFSAGTTAVAADVNANFSAVETAVDDNDARIDDLSTRAWSADGSDLLYDTGNVGIGTSAAGATLHLLNTGTSGAERVLAAYSPNELTGNYTGSIFFGDSDAPREAGHLAFIDSATDGLESIAFSIHSAGILMTITGNGNVGIGTTLPSFPIELSSGAYVSAGGVWTDASSRDYKEDIRELTYEDAAAALVGLEPSRFKYKEDQYEDHLGFIAEDVPDLVATGDRKGLSPMDIVAVLTRVVQQQQQEIEALKLFVEKNQ